MTIVYPYPKFINKYNTVLTKLVIKRNKKNQ